MTKTVVDPAPGRPFRHGLPRRRRWQDRGMRFESTVELGGKTATGIPVPDEVVAGLGESKRPPVTISLNGYTYQTTAVRMGGRFLVPLSAEHREAAGVAAGDAVTVDIALDAAPRE